MKVCLYLQNYEKKTMLSVELFPKLSTTKLKFYELWLEDYFINNENKEIYESIKKIKEIKRSNRKYDNIILNSDEDINKLCEELEKDNIEIFWNKSDYELYLENLIKKLKDIVDLIMIMKLVDPMIPFNYVTSLTREFSLISKDNSKISQEAIEKIDKEFNPKKFAKEEYISAGSKF